MMNIRKLRDPKKCITLQQLIRDYERDGSLKKLAQDTGMHVNTIKRIFAENGVKINGKGRPKIKIRGEGR